MVNEKYYGYGTAPSIIRELFAYGLEQAKKLGRDKVYDYSLGNPSIPAPKKVNETIKKLVDEESSILLHGYSMAPGFESTRESIAANLRKRFNTNAQANELFMTCGCAPALVSVACALTLFFEAVADHLSETRSVGIRILCEVIADRRIVPSRSRFTFFRSYHVVCI